MRPYFACAALLITTPTFCQSQTLDVPPRGRLGVRVILGGGSPVSIDVTTPLMELVKRLAGPWELVPTGKAYWIGYTDDMFSIAAHEDGAIEPLLRLFQVSKDLHTKEGVVLCLHLVGIDSTVVGRFTERFSNPKARAALLGLVGDKDCGDLVVQLLARDPWRSDLPTLLETLKTTKAPRKVIISALFRYTDGRSPFRGSIGEDWGTISVEYRDGTTVRRLAELKTVIREIKNDDPQTINAMLQPGMVVQWGGEGRILRKIEPRDAQALRTVFKGQDPTEALNELFHLSKDKVSVFSYCDLGEEEFWHVVEARCLAIVSAERAREMWLNYFKTNGLLQAEPRLGGRS